MKKVSGLRYAKTLLLTSIALPLTVGAQSPLPTFDKTFDPATIGPGSVSTLRFDITNPASQPAQNLAFADTLPAAVTIASPANVNSTCLGTVSAPDGGSVIALSGGGVGSSSSCSISVDVTSGTVGVHSNVSGDLTSSAGNSGPASADLTVVDDRPGFSKSFSPSSVFFGGRTTLTLTFDNTANPAAAANLTFTDNLPFGLVIANPSNGAATCTGGVLTATPGQDVISYRPSFFGDATVGAASSCSITVDVIGNFVGVFDNVTGELTSTPVASGLVRSSGIASATLTVTIEEIALTKSFTDDPVAPGGTVNLEFTIRNLNRRSPATNIAFSDNLDGALTGLVASGLPINNICGSGSSLTGTSSISLTGGNLGVEGTCTFSVAVNVPSTAVPGAFTNTTSSITADIDGNPVTGDPASDVLFVSPIPVLTKTFTDDPVGAGGSVTLEFTITNTSPTSDATNLFFEDVFDEVIRTASSTPAAGFCGAGSTATFTPLINPPGSDAIPARLVVSGASLIAGASCTFSVTLDIFEGAAGASYSNTTSAITATIDGETVTGNPASDALVVIGAPALVKEFTGGPATPGGTTTLEFTLTHDENAPGDATAITFTDDLDATLSGLVATGLPLNNVCGTGSSISDSGTPTLTFAGGTLVPGGSCTFSVSLSVPASAPPGAHTNTTSMVVATVSGVSAENNAASDDLQIAGLTLTKEFTDDPALPGGSVTLQFTLSNINPTLDATGISFLDDLDDTLNGLAATGTFPQNDICGTGSTLDAVGANQLLVLQGGVLLASTSCTFQVTLQVPALAVPDDYANVTSAVGATIGGSNVVFDAARDDLTVAGDFLAISKDFTDDPASPGGNVALSFTISNLAPSDTVTDIMFTDDLDAALSGLVAVALPTNAELAAAGCGAGAMISGIGLLTFDGGTLAGGAECTFDVTLAVPASTAIGSVATNTTSEVTGLIGAVLVTGDPASDDLLIDFVEFDKTFLQSAGVGGSVVLQFNIQNLGSTSVDGLSFTDDLDAVISGLVATGLPANDVCGTGSVLDGTSLLSLTGGDLLPAGSCTFDVTLQVPASAVPGSFVNTTTDLEQDIAGQRFTVADPAIDSLVIVDFIDADGDTVDDRVDACLGTVIPEGVPTKRLGTNRFALVDDDTIFDTKRPGGGGQGPQVVFTTTDTAGCSCEQIIAEQGLGQGHTKFGCSKGAMETWIDLVGGSSAVQDLPGLLDNRPNKASRKKPKP